MTTKHSPVRLIKCNEVLERLCVSRMTLHRMTPRRQVSATCSCRRAFVGLALNGRGRMV